MKYLTNYLTLRLVTFLFIFSSAYLIQAQQNNAVADDATTLIRLLRKDYSSLIDEKTKNEILNEDRKKSINILREYADKTILNSELSKANSSYKSFLDEITNAKNEIKKIEDQIKEFKDAPSQKIVTRLFGGAVTLGDFQEKIEVQNKKITENLYKIDSIYFDKLIKAFVKTNPYLKDIAEAFKVKYESLQKREIDIAASSISQATIDKSLPFIGGGGLSFEEGVDGLARFLAKRFKEELATQIFDKVKEKLNNTDSISDKFLELKLMMPNTVAFMNGIDAVELSGLMDALKENIKKDLDNLVENLPRLEKSPKIRELISKNENLRLIVEGLKLMKALSDTNHPLDYVDVLATSSFVSDWSDPHRTPMGRYNVAQGIKLSSLLVNCFTVKQPEGRNWIHLEYWKAHAKDVDFYKTFLGMLMYQDTTYYNISINGNTLQQLLTNAHTDLNSLEDIRKDLEPAFSQFLMSAEKLNNKITQIKQLKSNGVKIKGDTLHAYVSDILSLLEEGINSTESLINFLSEDEVKIGLKIKPFFEYADLSNDVMLHLSKKEFAKALTMSIEVYQDLRSRGDSTNSLDILAEARLLVEKLGRNEDLRLIIQITKTISSNEEIKLDQLNGLKNIFKNLILEDVYEDQLSDFSNTLKKADHAEDYTTLTNLVKDLRSSRFEVLFEQKDFVGAYARISELVDEGRDVPEEVYKALIDFIVKRKNSDFTNLLTSYNSIKGITAKAPYDATADSNYDKLKKAFDALKDNKQAIAKLLATEVLKKASTEILNQLNTRIEQITNDSSERKTLVNVKTTLNKISGQLETFIGDLDYEVFKTKTEEYIKEFGVDMTKILYSNYINKLPDASREEVVKYVNFLIAIAKAEDAEDAEQAITALALPAGSSAIKRNNPFNVSLNSYPGALFSLENQLNVDDAPAFTPSFTAPVGIAISGQNKKEASHSLFLTFIDIGTLTALRINSTDAPLPEFTFKNILAPGAYYIYGFKNNPLSLGIGAQYGPNSRESDDGSLIRSIRYGISLTIDIPLLNFYTQTK